MKKAIEEAAIREAEDALRVAEELTEKIEIWIKPKISSHEIFYI